LGLREVRTAESFAAAEYDFQSAWAELRFQRNWCCFRERDDEFVHLCGSPECRRSGSSVLDQPVRGQAK
jgi:hypothetical protein